MNTSGLTIYVTMKCCDYNDDGSSLCSGGVPIYAYMSEESAKVAVESNIAATTEYYEKLGEIHGGHIQFYATAVPGYECKSKYGKYCATIEEAQRSDDWDDWKRSQEGMEIINRITNEDFYVPVIVNGQISSE